MAITVSHPRASRARRNTPVTTYYLLAVATAILVLIGLAVVLSSSSIDSLRDEGDAYALFRAQLIYLALGVVVLAICSRIPPALWRKLAPWLVAVVMTALVFVGLSPLGLAEGGNRNWINLGVLTAQPSEAAKLALALYLGSVLALARPRLHRWGGAIFPAGIVALAVVGLVVWGRDIGTASVLVVLIAAAYWTAGLPARFFFMGAGIAAGILAVTIANIPNLKLRVDTWLAEECDIAGACLQATHGTWALASGGLWGLGPGLSREKWLLLPKLHNDFVYAILGEEFGLLGTLLVLVALAMMVVAVNRLVSRHRDRFIQISSAAIGAWIVGQAMLNIAVVIGFAPVTGVPLPFISSGGSSLVTSLAGIGVLLSFARLEPGAAAERQTRRSFMRRTAAAIARKDREARE